MSENLSRRDVVKMTAAGLAGVTGCAATQQPGTQQPEPQQAAGVDVPFDSPGWIDAHVHVWTDDFARYPLAAGFTQEQMRPARFTPEDLFAHCEPCGVRRINLIQMSFYRFDNRYMLDTMERYPGRFAGTAVIDVTARDVADQMKRLARRRVRAFRIYPALAKRKPADWLKPDGYKTMFAVGARLNQAMSCLIDTRALPELDRMCARYPDTPVIIDHLCRIGKPSGIEPNQIDALCRMSRHRRIMVKVGAFYALGKRTWPYDDLLPLIQRVVEAFGPQRCMWETDSPYQVVRGTYAGSLALIRDRCRFLSSADKEQILHKTAETFFFS